ncbi:MAG: adenylate/guanylate cyclase domain-containing protein [Verrucomicrobia bacterium]|nr:adenylate/guanylate cyclase domain-containing protein [Verrucomicrobiota bacterium]
MSTKSQNKCQILKNSAIEAIPYVVAVLCVVFGFFILGQESTSKGEVLFWKIESILTHYQFQILSYLPAYSGSEEFAHRIPDWGSIILLTILVFSGTFLSWCCSASKILLVGIFSLIGLLLVEILLLGTLGLDIPMAVPVGCAALASVGCIFLRWSRDQVIQHEVAEDRDRLGRIFERMLSPEVARQILKCAQAGKLETEGSRSTITVLFADIRGFTDLMNYEHEQAENHILRHNLRGAKAEEYRDFHGAQLLKTINIYLSLMTEVIMNHGGTLDKYIGDSVMAFWGEPTPNEHHALAGVRAAVAMQEEIFKLNRQRQVENQKIADFNAEAISRDEPQKEFLPILTVGIGVNTGEAIVGFIGSKSAMAYTVVGREVNLASRLERLAGVGKIHIGESTYEQLCKDEPEWSEKCSAVPPIHIKGFQNMVGYYEVNWKTREMAIEEWGWKWVIGN